MKEIRMNIESYLYRVKYNYFLKDSIKETGFGAQNGSRIGCLMGNPEPRKSKDFKWFSELFGISEGFILGSISVPWISVLFQNAEERLKTKWAFVNPGNLWQYVFRKFQVNI